MSSINELYNLSSISAQVNHSDQIKAAENKDREINTPRNNELHAQDQVQISDAAKDLLKMRLEASHYVKTVSEAKTIPEDRMNQLKQKIANKNYLNEQIEDEIVNKLSSFPDYL